MAGGYQHGRGPRSRSLVFTSTLWLPFAPGVRVCSSVPMHVWGCVPGVTNPPGHGHLTLPEAPLLPPAWETLPVLPLLRASWRGHGVSSLGSLPLNSGHLGQGPAGGGAGLGSAELVQAVTGFFPFPSWGWGGLNSTSAPSPFPLTPAFDFSLLFWAMWAF